MLTALWQIFNADTAYFQHLPELVNRFLLPPDPIVLHYTLNPNLPPPEKPSAWDVEVKVDDSNLKARMQHVVVSMAQDSARDLTKLDEEVSASTFDLRLTTDVCSSRRSHCTSSRSTTPT